MDGVIKFNLKSDAVPTIFNHARPTKRPALSMKREANRIKKAYLEKAVSEKNHPNNHPKQHPNKQGTFLCMDQYIEQPLSTEESSNIIKR